MKKFYKFSIVIITFLFLLLPIKISAKEEVNIYLFYGDGCPHCKALEESLNLLKNDYPNISIHYYETWYNKDSAKKLQEVGDLLDVEIKGVPFTIIGGKTFSGFSSGITDKEIEEAIKYYQKENNKCNDLVGNFLGVTKENLELKNCNEINQNNNFKINVPFFGEVNTRNLSLPIISILIGTLDGFNPCAMWILLFLITMLLNLKDKKRMWLLGITFLVTSAIIYLLFMISWLNLAKYIGSIFYVRCFIALIALIGGFINLKNYFNTKNDGCHVVKKEKRKKILTKIKKFTSEKSLILSLLGIITLAVSVNFIELVCSAGLPVIFTQILAMNSLSNIEYFIYIFLYILFFLIDDIIVFIIAMKTLTVTGISTKYGKYSHLIGGVLMILIGILLIFKPEWLMFNF